MAKPEWGAKRICHHCGARYYDMLRDPIVCPKCGTPFDPEAFLRSRRSRSAIIEETLPVKPLIDTEIEDETVEAGEVEEIEEVETVEETGEEDEVAPTAPDLTPGEGEEDTYEDTAEGEEDLMEDASELGDDDVDDVIGLEEGPEEDR